VYGVEAKLSVNVHTLALQLAQYFSTDNEVLQGIINKRLDMDAYGRFYFNQMTRNENTFKGAFDRKTRQKDFHEGYFFLMLNKIKEKLGMH